MGALAWLGHRFSSFPCMGIWDKGLPITHTIIIPALLPRPPFIRPGCGWGDWLARFTLSFILATGQAGAWDMGQPLQTATQHFISYAQSSLNIVSLSYSCPYLSCVSCPHLHIVPGPCSHFSPTEKDHTSLLFWNQAFLSFLAWGQAVVLVETGMGDLWINVFFSNHKQAQSSFQGK
jgi:hypothetical protein